MSWLVCPIDKIISGGQSGADLGGLMAGRRLGIATGGTMPHGWLTENGPKPEYEAEFGLVQHTSSAYPPRTLCNVTDSDGTVLFGRLKGGTRLTRDMAMHINKPCILINDDGVGERMRFKKWLGDNSIRVLNVAGNRESNAPGLEQKVTNFLVEELGG